MVVKMEEGYDRVSGGHVSRGAAPRSRCSPARSSRWSGFLPVGFAKSGAGEYAGGIFWVVGIALIASWLVAVIFTPYLGVKLLPNYTNRPHHDPLPHPDVPTPALGHHRVRAAPAAGRRGDGKRCSRARSTA